MQEFGRASRCKISGAQDFGRASRCNISGTRTRAAAPLYERIHARHTPDVPQPCRVCDTGGLPSGAAGRGCPSRHEGRGRLLRRVCGHHHRHPQAIARRQFRQDPGVCVYYPAGGRAASSIRCPDGTRASSPPSCMSAIAPTATAEDLTPSVAFTLLAPSLSHQVCSKFEDEGAERVLGIVASALLDSPLQNCSLDGELRHRPPIFVEKASHLPNTPWTPVIARLNPASIRTEPPSGARDAAAADHANFSGQSAAHCGSSVLALR